MTVAELRDICNNLIENGEGDRAIVVARDEEGNDHNLVNGHWLAAFDADSGEVGVEELTPELEKDGYAEEDVMDGGTPALILSP